jgi:hypothetical protein
MYSKSPRGGASGAGDVDFPGRLSSIRLNGTTFEGPALARAVAALAVITSLVSSYFSLGASAETRVGAFMDSKTASKTLSILLFLGVAIVLVDSFDNLVTAVWLITFGCSAVFFYSGSFTGSALALTDMAGAVSVAKRAA